MAKEPPRNDFQEHCKAVREAAIRAEARLALEGNPVFTDLRNERDALLAMLIEKDAEIARLREDLT